MPLNQIQRVPGYLDHTHSVFIKDRKTEHLRKEIDLLPSKCKEIFVLSKFEGMKYKEIATQLNISIKTVESQMSIALSKLRKELQKIKWDL